MRPSPKACFWLSILNVPNSKDRPKSHTPKDTSLSAHPNRVVVGDDKSLMSYALEAVDVNWFRKPLEGEVLTARIRHRGHLHRCFIEGDDPIRVYFETPARAVTPGQAVVVYAGEEVVAGGWIKQSLSTLNEPVFKKSLNLHM